MTYNYDPVTSSYSNLSSGTTSSAATASSATSSDPLFAKKDAATEVDSLLSTNNSAIADIEAKIANATDDEAKQILLEEKQRLVAEKQQLQASQVTLQNEIKSLKVEFETSKTKLSLLKSELTQLENKKARYENALKADNATLASKQSDVKDTDSDITSMSAKLSEEIETMQSTSDQIEAESEAELQKQRQAILQANVIAEAKVRAGEIKSEDIPSFIASQVSGFTSTGSTTRMGELSSQNDKIKAYCTKLGSLIIKKVSLENYAEALSTKIASSGELIGSMNTAIGEKQSEIKAEQSVYKDKMNGITEKNAKYEATELQVNTIDIKIEAIDARYAQYNTTEDPSAAANTAQPQTAATAQTSSAQTTSAAATTQNNTDVESESEDFSSYDNMFDRINQEFSESVSKTADSAEVTTYKSKVDDAENLIVTLRHKLSDDAQKIIEERLAATKR